MGPAAWAAVGRALALASAQALLGGPNAVPRLIGKQVLFNIEQQRFETAEILLRDLAFRHRSIFDQFIDEFGDELPPELLAELGVEPKE